jgi:hypothetical protein
MVQRSQYSDYATGPTIRGSKLSRGNTFLFPETSISALGTKELPSRWVPEALPPVVQRPGSEADHSTTTTTEIKNEWSHSSILPYTFMACTGMVLPFIYRRYYAVTWSEKTFSLVLRRATNPGLFIRHLFLLLASCKVSFFFTRFTFLGTIPKRASAARPTRSKTQFLLADLSKGAHS